MLSVITMDNQVRKLMEEINKHGKIGIASMKAGMNRKTGSKYIKEGKLPSELKPSRTWRTRSNPFEVMLLGSDQANYMVLQTEKLQTGWFFGLRSTFLRVKTPF